MHPKNKNVIHISDASDDDEIEWTDDAEEDEATMLTHFDRDDGMLRTRLSAAKTYTMNLLLFSDNSAALADVITAFGKDRSVAISADETRTALIHVARHDAGQLICESGDLGHIDYFVLFIDSKCRLQGRLIDAVEACVPGLKEAISATVLVKSGRTPLGAPYLPLGSALIMETAAWENKSLPTFIVLAPIMVVPESIDDTNNVYHAYAAALSAASSHVHATNADSESCSFTVGCPVYPCKRSETQLRDAVCFANEYGFEYVLGSGGMLHSQLYVMP